MANPGDGLYFPYDDQNSHQQYSQPHSGQQSQQSQQQRLTWSVPSSQQQSSQPMTSTSSGINMQPYKRSSSPLPMSMAQHNQYNDATADAQTHQLMASWQMNAGAHMPAVSLGLDTSSFQQPTTFDSYAGSFQTSPQEFMESQQPAFSQQNDVDQHSYTHQDLGVGLDVNTSMAFDQSVMSFQNNLANVPQLQTLAQVQSMQIHWPDVDNALLNYNPMSQQQFAVGSPSEDSFEVRSLSSSDTSGWGLVTNNHMPSTHTAIFNPEQTLHPRSWSDSSSEKGHQPSNSWDESYINIHNGSLGSPSSEDGSQSHFSDNSFNLNQNRPSPPPALTTTDVKPIPIRRTSSQRKSPTSPTAAGRPSGRVAKTPIAKSNSNGKASGARRALGASKEEKRVGRRKGPLSADQRKQASEIRKLGACIRCRFLKKTCDKGDPCAGCQPSHARLWLVPCTRVDIKDLGYFLKGWKADYERHVSLAVSVTNVKGFSEQERCLFVTHGYGHYLPIKAREVYVRDESVFNVDWVETHTGQNEDFTIGTARLSAGVEGISTSLLNEYLDHHIDGGFEKFVDEHFQGTPFVTEILNIAYRYYTKEKTPVIRNALKLVLAYNLTQAICLVKGIPEEEEFDGKIECESSEFHGETAAPMMINFQVKTAMADLWRELQKGLLEDLSSLYSSIYSKDKLKNWPTIFMLASVLLVVWEEMQFDCRYRVPDEKVVDKFCHDMESTPVGVIVGLFSAISQKVPAFTEWDTNKHHALLGSNPHVCEAMEDVRDGVQKHGE